MQDDNADTADIAKPMTVEHMTQFPGTSSPEQANLDAILKSSTYRIAHEDQDLLNSNAMRGVRMLLEIHQAGSASGNSRD